MEFLTTEQVAEKLGVTPRRVQAMAQSGRLPASRFGEGNRHETNFHFIGVDLLRNLSAIVLCAIGEASKYCHYPGG
jgi:excisionase family DNA binding protein